MCFVDVGLGTRAVVSRGDGFQQLFKIKQKRQDLNGKQILHVGYLLYLLRSIVSPGAQYDLSLGNGVVP